MGPAAGFAYSSGAPPQRRDQPEPHEVIRVGLYLGEHLGQRPTSLIRVELNDQGGSL